MPSKASLAWLSLEMGCRMGWVERRLSCRMTPDFSAPAFSQICHSGLKWSVALVPIHDANPSLSQRLSHQAVVTRSPNHWWAISCAITPKTFCLVSSELVLGSNSRMDSLYV